jgi:molybdate/tungstate transport system substrate-binding protein
VTLLLEGSGSVEVCRKLTALGRTCDVLALADNRLVTELLPGVCSWRIDFAADELVLGVGVRAPHVEEAERDWAAAVLRDGLRLARANANTSPLGYRTLLALMLQERLGATGLHDGFLARCPKVLDDVERLSALLKSGEVDYAMVYRSTCVAHGIRWIALDPRVNLGSVDVDYSAARVSFPRLKAGAQEIVTVRGAPAVWTLTEPAGIAHPTAADAVIADLLTRTVALDAVGLRPIHRPRFFGPRSIYPRFAAVADYAGELR